MEFEYTDYGKVVDGIKVLMSSSGIVAMCCGACSVTLSGLGPVVLVHPALLHVLNSDELMAVVYHELGHVVNGHCVEGSTGIVLDPTHEAMADQHAVANCGLEVTRSAFAKLANFFLTEEFKYQLETSIAQANLGWPRLRAWVIKYSYYAMAKKALKSRVAAMH